MRWMLRRLWWVVMERPCTVGLTTLALLAGLLFWGRLLMQDVPRTAVAEPEAEAAVAETDTPDEPDVKPAPEIADESVVTDGALR